MKILVFEYSTLIYQENLITEGLNILKSLLEDLDSVDEYDVTYLLSENLKITTLKNSKRIIIQNSLFEWLDDNCECYDACLFVAPEDNYIQCKITEILEKHDILIFSSNSYACSICTSKNKTYDMIPNTILKIPTIYTTLDTINYTKINDILKNNTLVIKPDSKTSSNHIYIIHTSHELKKVLKIYKKNSINEFLIQKYISGEHISTSQIHNNAKTDFISLNKQIMKTTPTQLEYIGSKTPIQHHLINKIKNISKEIINSISGLKGFVGIDFIIKDDKIYFVEINSRITTPYIILHKNTNINLTKYLIDTRLDKKTEEIKVLIEGEFYK